MVRVGHKWTQSGTSIANLIEYDQRDTWVHKGLNMDANRDSNVRHDWTWVSTKRTWTQTRTTMLDPTEHERAPSKHGLKREHGHQHTYVWWARHEYEWTFQHELAKMMAVGSFEALSKGCEVLWVVEYFGLKDYQNFGATIALYYHIIMLLPSLPPPNA